MSTQQHFVVSDAGKVEPATRNTNPTLRRVSQYIAEQAKQMEDREAIYDLYMSIAITSLYHLIYNGGYPKKILRVVQNAMNYMANLEKSTSTKH